MLNIVWPIFIIISFSYAIFFGNLNSLNAEIFSSLENAIKLSINLLETICLWNGIMQIASKTTVIDKLTSFLKPIIRYLFPDLKKKPKIQKEISMNMIANILGLGNAATPLGLKAMKSMQEENEDKNSFYVVNALEMGNYETTDDSDTSTSAPAPTGNSDNYKVKNVFDLAGNVSDWTLEANYTLIRISRRRPLPQYQFWHYSCRLSQQQQSELFLQLRWFSPHTLLVELSAKAVKSE